MKFRALLKKFCKSESGAVTVDWVVLTAAVVSLGLVIAGEMKTAASKMVTSISDSIDNISVGAP